MRSFPPVRSPAAACRVAARRSWRSFSFPPNRFLVGGEGWGEGEGTHTDELFRACKKIRDAARPDASRVCEHRPLTQPSPPNNETVWGRGLFRHVASRGAHDSPSPSAGFGFRMRARYVVRGRVPSSLSIA